MLKKTRNTQTQHSTVSSLNRFYPGGTGKLEPLRDKVSRICLWALFIGVMGALVTYFGILSGTVAIPAGMTVIKLLLLDFILGLLEGLFVATVAEVISKKNADNWLESNRETFIRKDQQTERPSDRHAERVKRDISAEIDAQQKLREQERNQKSSI